MKVQVPKSLSATGMAADGSAILYEDNHLIAVFKPAGVLSQGDLPAGRQARQDTMLERVRSYLRQKYKKPGNVFVGLLHRLDRPASGIILFAKTSKGASRLSEQFRNHQIEKIYHAIVLGKPEKEKGVFTHFLIKDEKLKKALRRPTPQGKLESNLYYETIKSNKKYALLKIKIDTGKFHQIRSQLSLAGFPILGDVKYGGQRWRDKKSPDGFAIENPRCRLRRAFSVKSERSRDIALCATSLSFKNTTGEKIINIKIDLPEEWEKFI